LSEKSSSIKNAEKQEKVQAASVASLFRSKGRKSKKKKEKKKKKNIVVQLQTNVFHGLMKIYILLLFQVTFVFSLYEEVPNFLIRAHPFPRDTLFSHRHSVQVISLTDNAPNGLYLSHFVRIVSKMVASHCQLKHTPFYYTRINTH
jgi:hypothetical protein